MNTSRRFVALLIAGAALIATACRDSVAPVSDARSTTTLALLEDQSFSRIVSGTEGAGAVEFTFTFTTAAGSARIGEFLLEWEANSVCDRETSGYGVEFWKQDCAPETDNVEMTARVWKEDGRVYADFSPDIRFSPVKNVTLRINRPEIIGRKVNKRLVNQYSIYYTHRIGDNRYYIDEAWFDPEQRSHFDVRSGDVWREIRHFSGFVIRTGDCDVNDMMCITSLR